MRTLSNTGNFRTLYQLSNEVRMAAQPMMRFGQFTRAEVGWGPHMGLEYRFLKVSDLNQLGRRIGENEDIPEATSSDTYGTVSVAEYGLQLKWTWLSSLLNQLSLEDMYVIQLRNSAARTLDYIAAGPFMLTPVVYTPTGPFSAKSATLTTTGVISASSSRPIDTWDVKNIVDQMRSTLRIPGWAGGREYICIANTLALRGIKESSEWIEASKYAQPEKLLSGEVGMYYGVRFVEESNVLRALPGGGGEMCFFGDDPVVMLEAYPLEIQAGFGGDFSYGRVKGIRWVWVGGVALTYNFLTDSRTTTLRVSSSVASGVPVYVAP